MSPSWFSCAATVLLGPLAALVGGIIVVVQTQDVVVGVIAGIAGLAAGLVVGFVIAWISMHKWPTEYDDVDQQTYERAMREAKEWDSRPHSRIEEMSWTVFAMALFFSGTMTAFAGTLVVGWLLGG